MWNTYSGIQLEGSDLIQILYQKLEPGTCSHSNTTCAALHPLYRTTRVPYHASALPGRGGRGRGRGSHLSLLVGLVWVWSGFGLGLFNLLDGLDGGVGVGVLRYFTTLALLLPPYSLLCTPKMVFPLEYVCIHVYPLQGRKSCIIQYLVGYPCVFHM